MVKKGYKQSKQEMKSYFPEMKNQELEVELQDDELNLKAKDIKDKEMKNSTTTTVELELDLRTGRVKAKAKDLFTIPPRIFFPESVPVPGSGIAEYIQLASNDHGIDLLGLHEDEKVKGTFSGDTTSNSAKKYLKTGAGNYTSRSTFGSTMTSLEVVYFLFR